MATIRPFRALRPTPASIARVAAVPYDVVSGDEARAMAEGNPLSFLHVSRAEIDLPAGTPTYGDAVYAAAAARFESLKREAPLVRDEQPALYVYRLHNGDHTQTGVAGCFSLEEYDRGVIKKHERTRQDKEDDRTRHVAALRAQTGLVFLAFRAQAAIDAVVAKVCAGAPLFDFAGPGGVRHVVWRTAADEAAALTEAFDSVPALYIADGHHRAASAARARAMMGSPEADGMLAVAFPGDQLRILPYNRVVRDLGGRTPRPSSARSRSAFRSGAGHPPPLDRARSRCIWPADGARSSLDALLRIGDPTSALDVTRLQDGVLEPVLGIGDVRTDSRIDFVGVPGSRRNWSGSWTAAARRSRSRCIPSTSPI